MKAARVSVLTSVCMAASIGPVFAGPPPAPATWSGFYAGANLGANLIDGKNDYGDANNYVSGSSGPPVSSPGASVSTGFQGGYNWQFGNLVVGGEVDYRYLGTGPTTSENWYGYGTNAGSTKMTASQAVSVRARAGYDVNNVLIFGTAGIAMVDIDNKTTLSGKNGTFRASGWKPAFVAGAGVETKVLEHVSLRAEVLHYFIPSTSGGFSDPTLGSPPVKYNDQGSTILGVAVNFHF